MSRLDFLEIEGVQDEGTIRPSVHCLSILAGTRAAGLIRRAFSSSISREEQTG